MLQIKAEFIILLIFRFKKMLNTNLKVCLVYSCYTVNSTKN